MSKTTQATPAQVKKWEAAILKDRERQSKRDAPRETAKALLAQFDGVKSWGEYADKLRDCAADILDQLTCDDILRIPSRAEFEASAAAADRTGATMMALDYRILAMEAKQYLILMTGLFAAYVGAESKDPQKAAAVLRIFEVLLRQNEEVLTNTRGIPRMVEAAREAHEKPMEAADEFIRRLYGCLTIDARRVYEKMRETGWSQNKTAKDLRMSRNTVAKLVRNQIVPNMEAIGMPIPDGKKRGPAPGWRRNKRTGDVWKP